MFANFLNQICI